MAAEIVSSGGSVSKAGTFTPEPPPAPDLNPYDDPGPWNTIDFGGVRVPGVIQSVDGAEKPEEWTQQKGTGSSGATTVWKGTKNAEAIKVVTAMTTREHIAAYYVLARTLRPKLGTKPPSLVVTNAIFNFAGITRIAGGNCAPPKWVASGGYWTGEITVAEYNPSKAAGTGPAGAAKPKANEPDPNADMKALVDKLTKEAESL